MNSNHLTPEAQQQLETVLVAVQNLNLRQFIFEPNTEATCNRLRKFLNSQLSRSLDGYQVQINVQPKWLHLTFREKAFWFFRRILAKLHLVPYRPDPKNVIDVDLMAIPDSTNVINIAFDITPTGVKVD